MKISENSLTKRLGLQLPLIVAPMAGGPSTPALVVGASKSGALGSIGAAYSTGKMIEEFVSTVRSQTDRPFAINLFIPHVIPEITEAKISRAIKETESYRSELGLSRPVLVPPFEESFEDQFEAVLKVKPAVLSFVFGILGADFVKAAKKEDIFLLGTATSLDEALALQDSGVDAITLQGIEAGGHRGIFEANAEDSETPVMTLLQVCNSKITIPLVAAGGIMNSEEMKCAFLKGAQAVQMGTAFLACAEAGTSPPYRRALLESPVRKTKTTRVFSGRLARGIVNRFITEMENNSDSILPFPVQNKFTRDLRTASAKIGSSEFLSLWSGSGNGDLWTGSVSEKIAKLFDDLK